jgi:hypothetical protein
MADLEGRMRRDAIVCSFVVTLLLGARLAAQPPATRFASQEYQWPPASVVPASILPAYPVEPPRLGVISLAAYSDCGPEQPAAAPPDCSQPQAPPPSAGCPCDCCDCAPCECLERPAPCDKCPRINNLNPAWRVILGGSITADALYNSARPVAAGTPFFLAPRGPFEDDTFDIHARGTSIYLAATGPQIGEFQAGGLIMFALYNDSILLDRYGFLPYQAFGELKNETWRIAAGLQMDIFAPVLPNVLPFSFLAASGNAGLYRGQFRVERFWYPAADEQITLTAGVSDANPTLVNNDVLTEDNGWPNFEARAAWAVGQPQMVGLLPMRPFEVGVSGVVGEIRDTVFAPVGLSRFVADVWGLAADFRWRVNDFWGFAGELFTGQGLGTYSGGIFQTANPSTFSSIHTSGGWLELYCYLTPCLHTHLGYAVDDPHNVDLFLSQVARNETVFANLLWDVTKSLRLGFEITFRDTDYVALPDNDGVGLHGQMQWKF